jgi:hypothetical protein
MSKYQKLKFFKILVLGIKLRMSERSVTPVKQIVKEDKPCPGAPERKPNVFNPQTLNIVIPPYQGTTDELRAEKRARSVICKTPESKVRPGQETTACPGAPMKKRRPDFME